MWLFLAFLCVPLIEIALFIQVGGAIGLWPTLGIVILTAIIGTWLVRAQGRLALNQLRGTFSQLRDPTEPLVSGAMVLFAGALLLTPGFFTDTVGFLLLIPGVRAAAYRYIRARVTIQSFDMGGAQAGRPDPQAHGQARGPIIDAEYQEVDPAKHPGQGPSGWTRH